MKPPDPLFAVRSHAGAVSHVAFHPSNQSLILSTGSDGTASLWDFETSQRKALWKDLHGHNAIMCAEFLSPSGDSIVSQGRDANLSIWNVDQSSSITPLISIATRCYSFCKVVPLSSTELLLPSEDPTLLNLWDIRTADPHTSPSPIGSADSQRQTAERFGMLMCMAIDGRESNIVHCGYESGHLCAWDRRKGVEMLYSLHTGPDPVMCLETYPSSKGYTELFAGGASNTFHHIRVFSHSSHHDDDEVDTHPPESETHRASENDDDHQTANEDDGDHGSTEASGRDLRIHQVSYNAEVQPSSCTLPHMGVGSVAVRGDGQLVACGGWDDRIRVFQRRRMKALAVLQFHSGSVDALRFSCARLPWMQLGEREGERKGGNSLLATGGKDGRIAVWDLYNKRS